MAAKKTTEKDFKYLVIVESPAKSKTLTKILGKDYLVKSSIGHIRDLPAKGLGIDVKSNFEPTYEVMSGKKKVVDELNEYAKKAEKVFLASDPDREGEAISWHLSEIIKKKKSDMTRISFNQITPNAVLKAIESPREIDQGLVDAQQARRILDRLVGYKISPILWRKIGGRSAGRVQSIAVRLICEREEEIQAFTPEEYWSLDLNVEADDKKKRPDFMVKVFQVDSKRIVAPLKEVDENKNIVIRSEEEVNKIIERIKASQLKVKSITTKPSTKKPQAPFKTSTMQRSASNALGFTVKRAMQVAQGLYEGVKLGTGGDQVGLITYMRTDSLRIAPEAQEAAKEYIVKNFGEEFYPETPNAYGKVKKSKTNEQDAHEAIRPTYIEKKPETIRKYLTDEQYKLYKLIWQRFVASQMTPAKIQTKTVEIRPEADDLAMRASQSKKTFQGYSIVYEGAQEIHEENETAEVEAKFPENIAEGDLINYLDANPAQHFTEGPPRFNEASLVKTLEELGIGRPSTYAPTINTIQDRKYVEKLENSIALRPTKLGIQVNKLLVDHFGMYINSDFTSNMENSLDAVAEKNQNWIEMLKLFYYGKDWPKREKIKPARGKKKAEVEAQLAKLDKGFIDIVKKAGEEIESVEIPTEYDCPKCESVMNLKASRYGPFLGCSNYPDCKTIVNLTKEGTPAPDDRPYDEEDCPDCKNHSLVIRYGRYGDYIACTTDDCKYSSPLQRKTGLKCPREGCEGDIVEKKSRFGKVFFGCNSWSKTQCEQVFWYTPIDLDCPDCGKKMMYKNLKRGDKLACSDTKECGFNRLASASDIEKYRPKPAEGASEESKSVFSL